MQAHISGEVTNHAVVGATMRPATMVVSFGGSAIGTVNFPQVTLPGGGSADLSITSNMTVLDTDAFTAFAVAALEQAAVDVTISGNIDVHAAGVTFDGVTFDKTVTLKGALLCCAVLWVCVEPAERAGARITPSCALCTQVCLASLTRRRWCSRRTSWKGSRTSWF